MLETAVHAAIPGDPDALRDAASLLETNAAQGESIATDVAGARALVLGGWSAPSAAGFEAFTTQAEACAQALVDVGRDAATPLRAYADVLERAQRAYARAQADAESADRRADAAEDGSRGQREARDDVDEAHRAMETARADALAANARAAAAIAALAGEVPTAPPAPGTEAGGGGAREAFATSMWLGGKATDAVGGASHVAGKRASHLGRQLRTSPDRAARSAAARSLPQAGRTAKTLSRFARPLPGVGAVLDFGANYAEGHGVGESLGRTAVSTGFAAGGALAAGAACGAVTLGLAAVACGAGGAVAGGLFGDFVGDLAFGD